MIIITTITTNIAPNLVGGAGVDDLVVAVDPGLDVLAEDELAPPP